MLFKIAIVGALAMAVSAQRVITVTPCEDTGKGQIQELTITPCTTDPCELKKGSSAIFGFRYLSDQSSNKVKLEGIVTGPFGIRVPIPGMETDFCKVLKDHCPVKKGETYTGSFSVPIIRAPISRTTVEMKVLGDAGLSACFRFPLRLV